MHRTPPRQPARAAATWTRRAFVAVSVALLGACSKPAAPPAKSELNFSILSAESQASAEADWQPFLDDMAKALDKRMVIGGVSWAST